MKKILFSLLSLMGFGFSVFAQSHINIELLGATYTTPAVQFRVSWNAVPAGTCHNSKVWLWIDFIKVENDQPSGAWTRATIANPSPGTVAPETDKGFWLQGNTGSYNQMVTVPLTNIPANTTFNWCVYASDCPPTVTAADGTYTFSGTPPFTLIAANGATQPVTGTTLAASALTITPTTIMDETACPVVFCPYQGSDLYMDATHLCQQRASGAQNWEAYIKDTRDHELYRIVLMPDNKWWLAQNVKLASYNSTTIGAAISGCTKEECGRAYTWAQIYASYAGGSSGSTGNVQGICPPGWLLPTRLTYAALVGSFNSDADLTASLRSYNSNCSPKTDSYGWASNTGSANGAVRKDLCTWYTNDSGREDGLIVDETCDGNGCGQWHLGSLGDEGQLGVVRCYYLL